MEEDFSQPRMVHSVLGRGLHVTASTDSRQKSDNRVLGGSETRHGLMNSLVVEK